MLQLESRLSAKESDMTVEMNSRINQVGSAVGVALLIAEPCVSSLQLSSIHSSVRQELFKVGGCVSMLRHLHFYGTRRQCMHANAAKYPTASATLDSVLPLSWGPWRCQCFVAADVA